MYHKPSVQSLGLLVCLLLFVGCNQGRVPVNGKVVFADGSPLAEGTIIGESTIDGKPVGVQGKIEQDGSFKIGTALPGDGALPGKYRFIIMPRALGDSEIAEGKKPAVDGKYTNFDTADIFFEVMKNEKNEMTVTLKKPKDGAN